MNKSGHKKRSLKRLALVNGAYNAISVNLTYQKLPLSVARLGGAYLTLTNPSF